jgi:hypothetical protein
MARIQTCSVRGALFTAALALAGCGGGDPFLSSGTHSSSGETVSGAGTNATSAPTSGAVSAKAIVPSVSDGSAPVAREGAATWESASGVHYLFGGEAVTAGTPEALGDLWSYAGGAWTQLSYSNSPPPRAYGARWSDAEGNIYLFGGATYAAGIETTLADLWELPLGATSWLDVLPAGTVPAARSGATAWTDAAGHLWLQGGRTANSGVIEELADLWYFDPRANQWVSVGR